MSDHPPFRDRGDGFVPIHAPSGTSALAWTIFALQILLLVGLGVLIAAAFAGRRAAQPLPAAVAAGPEPDVLEVLRMRYARGDLDREQFLAATRDLADGEAPSTDAT